MQSPPRFRIPCARRWLAHIVPVALAPALFACSSSPPAQAPLSPQALAAVVDDPGVNRESLARAVDGLFADTAGQEAGGDRQLGETRAVIVMRAGRIIAERYAPGYHENTRFAGGGIARSITAVMIGMLVSDGRLRLNETAPVPAWQRPGDPRGEITLRHLLQMRSGLREEPGDEARMLFGAGRDDMAGAAEDQPLAAEPGARFQDDAASGIILADLAARVLAPAGDPDARRRAVADYLRTRLFEPVLMRGIVPSYDARGTMNGGAMIDATARDFVRFGEFLRNRGAVHGAQLVPRQWIDFMVSPSPREKQYGAGVWLNRAPTTGDARLFPQAGPRDMLAALGDGGQAVLVAPARKLVVVRLGATPPGGDAALMGRLRDIVSLFAGGPAR
nr:serine hydrolase [Novosphingobium sp. SG720]